jgi:hypothetical protein
VLTFRKADNVKAARAARTGGLSFLFEDVPFGRVVETLLDRLG